MKLILGLFLIIILMLTGCVKGVRTPTEVLDTIKIDMAKSQVYDLVDAQYFRDSDSLHGATISEVEFTNKGRVLDFTIGDFYHRSYYGYFFFDTKTNSEVALLVFEWNSDTVIATGLVPFARAQKIVEDKYDQPFRRETVDVVILVPLTKIADEYYWHWLETGELPKEIQIWVTK